MSKPKLFSMEQVESGLALGKIAYLNKPFPKDSFAQIIGKDMLVQGHLPRKEYNLLKAKDQYEEYKLPSEKGLKDWIGLRLK